MSVRLNHTIVHSHDKQVAAEFLARILGLEAPGTFAHFVTVDVSNGVSLDFDNASDVRPQHYAFLVDDAEFDPIFERVQAEGLEYWADPAQQMKGVINTRDHGRGFYFESPDGHLLEVITRPYGSG